MPGRRGQATRQRLLECTLATLASGSYRDIKVVDIAREAGTSPATFYQYFTDVDAAIAQLAMDMAADGAVVLGDLLAGTDWDGAGAEASVRRLVAGFLAFWDANRPLMAVIDLKAAEGEGRIRSTRKHLLAQFSTELAAQVRGHRGDGGPEVDPWAMASVAVTMLVNVAIQRDVFAASRISEGDLVDSVARLLLAAVTGAAGPPAELPG
ncbi:MAG: TetR family transcriptional regulator [Microthrixaceae bacterium]